MSRSFYLYGIHLNRFLCNSQQRRSKPYQLNVSVFFWEIKTMSKTYNLHSKIEKILWNYCGIAVATVNTARSILCKCDLPAVTLLVFRCHLLAVDETVFISSSSTLLICVHRVMCISICVFTFLLHTHKNYGVRFCYFSCFFHAVHFFGFTLLFIHRSSWSDLMFSVHKSPTIKKHTVTMVSMQRKKTTTKKKSLTIHSDFYVDKNR